MATVRLSFSPAPAHVRTARLVGVAVARRAGVPDSVLDEIRLAIGEACSRAVALHRRHELTDLVEVELSDEDQFTVRVTDRAPVDDAEAGHPGSLFADTSGSSLDDPDATVPIALLIDGYEDIVAETVTEEQVAVGMGLTLLISLVDELSVRPATVGTGTAVEMSWPTALSRKSG